MAPRKIKKKSPNRRASTVFRAARKLSNAPTRPQKLRPAPVPAPADIPHPATADAWERALHKTGLREETVKRKKKLAAILKRVKPRKAEANTVIFVTAEPLYQVVKGRRKVKQPAGERVGRNTRRRVYAFKVQAPSAKHPKGRLVPFYPRRERGLEKKLPPKAIKVHDFDPSYFKSKKVVNWWYQGTKLKDGTSQPRTVSVVGSKTKKTLTKKPHVPTHELELDDVKPFSIKRGKGKKTLDFMDDVVPEVSSLLQDQANETGEKRDFKLNWWATVKLPDNSMKTVSGFTQFKQSDMQQYMDIGFYEPFVARTLYALMAQTLAADGLVTTGSSNYIKRLAHNKDVPMREWRDSRGHKWKSMHKKHGADMGQVQLLRYDTVVEKVLTFS